MGTNLYRHKFFFFFGCFNWSCFLKTYVSSEVLHFISRIILLWWLFIITFSNKFSVFFLCNYIWWKSETKSDIKISLIITKVFLLFFFNNEELFMRKTEWVREKKIPSKSAKSFHYLHCNFFYFSFFIICVKGNPTTTKRENQATNTKVN